MDFRTVFLALGLPAAAALAVPQLDGTYWNSNWKTMYFERNGNQVAAEYIHDNGVLSATLSGDTLKGWWREYNNAQTCGPGGAWSGAILFLFDAAGTKFTGSWNYCGDSAVALDPNGTGWTGTKRDSGYTEADCGSAGRYWCDGVCMLAACDAPITEQNCKTAGHFWCGNTCKLTQCGNTAIRPARPAGPSADRLPMSLESPVDVSGRCLDAGRKPAQGVFFGN